MMYQIKAQTPANGPYYLTVPVSAWTYEIGQFDNGTDYLVNGNNWHVDATGTNVSQLINTAIGVMVAAGKTGSIFLRADASTADLHLIAHPNILITGEIGFLNYGSVTSCTNGSWIPHGLISNPGLTKGSITLSLRGNINYNSTIILMAPTVLDSNATMFQIQFTMWETVGWTIIPVTAVEAQTVYWFVAYYP
jgi:hypothetical protein